MSFEIKDKDLLGKIGRLKTKKGTVETPLLFPVINPNIQVIYPKRLKEDFGFEAVITNAYILKKRFQNKPAEHGLHEFLDFDGVVMTDSGAYQILVYGDIEVSQPEIVQYQEYIYSDIATILDIPTGWRVTRTQAKESVKETIHRAKDFFKIKTCDDILWVGPVQGGRHLDLVASSAAEMGKMPFEIHALGSPTEVMENYHFDVLVDMIMTAKMNLPVERPLHLFGAGHPMLFSLAVGLGCDLFDSAAYALYARENRYMTENGTWRLDELDYFPCQCPNCMCETPLEVMNKPKKERELFLAEHNLYVCKAELERVKQSIRDGRLWEHMEMRAHAHPALFAAFKNIKNFRDFIEKYSPTAKRRGLFFFNSVGLNRPEVVRHKYRLMERYQPPERMSVLLLIPQTQKKPYHKAKAFNLVETVFQRLGDSLSSKVHVCFYGAPFGVVPIELDEVYPLSQHETAFPLEVETLDYVAAQVTEYIKQRRYKAAVLLHDGSRIGNIMGKKCAKSCHKTEVHFEVIELEAEGSKNILVCLEMFLRKYLS
jgi:7-cyano-7-deazaguanine tRNA-ribosyltransferase